MKTEDIIQALNQSAEAQLAWVHEKLRHQRPDLATVPNRINRFAALVQHLLASTSRLEATRLAAAIAQEAHDLAVLRPAYHAEETWLLERAPVELRFSAPEEARSS